MSFNSLTDKTWIPLGLACTVAVCLIVVTRQFTTISQQAGDAYALAKAHESAIAILSANAASMNKHLENIDGIMAKQFDEGRRARVEVFKKLGISPEILQKIQEPQE